VGSGLETVKKNTLPQSRKSPLLMGGGSEKAFCKAKPLELGGAASNKFIINFKILTV
jgi:hypothetical protein